jgi:acyl carrier protein
LLIAKKYLTAKTMNDNNTGTTLKKVQQLFKSAMGDEVEVDMNTEKDMIRDWDSINHLNLIVELESEFNLGLSMEEIEKLSSVRQIVDLINSRKG